MKTNKALGYTEKLEQYRIDHEWSDYRVGRVIAVHKSHYMVKADDSEYSAEIIGNLRYAASSRVDFPTVGDWVAFTEMDSQQALIYHIYPRHSLLERQQAGTSNDRQVIASNIDTALIVLSANRDFSINRIERYLTICHAAKIQAIVILNKVDLLPETEVTAMKNAMTLRLPEVTVLAISQVTGQGLDELDSYLEKERTYCLLGSSGVGKSTLLNTLMGESVMQTGEISEYAERGKHVTTHRELSITPKGVIIIDNPGMREIGVTDGGVGETFSHIEQLAMQCKFNDCSHEHTSGCAVRSAIESGALPQETFENYLKMQREQTHFKSTSHERRQKHKALSKRVRQATQGKRR